MSQTGISRLDIISFSKTCIYRFLHRLVLSLGPSIRTSPIFKHILIAMSVYKMLHHSRLNYCWHQKHNLRPRRLNINNLRRHTDLLDTFSLGERIYRFISSFNQDGKSYGLSQLNEHFAECNLQQSRSEQPQNVVRCLHLSRSRQPQYHQQSSSTTISTKDVDQNADADDENSENSKVVPEILDIEEAASMPCDDQPQFQRGNLQPDSTYSKTSQRTF